MRDFRDAKAIAVTLRDALADRGLKLSHSECLELTARALGEPDWNTLSAHITRAASAAETAGPLAADADPAAQWPEVARVFYERHLTPDDRRARVQASPWTPIFEEANALFSRGADPNGAEVLDVVRRWTQLSSVRGGDNEELRRKYAAAYREALADAEVAPRLPISHEVLEFLGPAFFRVRSEAPGEGQA
jgi:hypothetical protein